MAQRTCIVDGCERLTGPHSGRGLCQYHYDYRRRRGLLPPLPPKSTAERFWEKVDKDGPVPEYAPQFGPCWIWSGGMNQGYGRVRIDDGRAIGAHRAAYEILVGPVPAGLELDHLCRVRACVNPAHLEPVTKLENQRRSPLSRRTLTHCKHGHEFTPENTYWQTRNGGLPMRQCRACGRAATKRYMARKKVVT